MAISKQAPTADFITEAVIYEVHIDLWGISLGWGDAIYDALQECVLLTSVDPGVSLEMNACPANYSITFRTTLPEQRDKAKAIATRLLNLAKQTILDDLIY